MPRTHNVPFMATRLMAGAAPLSRQLYDEIRAAIVQGRLGAGARLPSSRSLSVQLGVARNTVLLAFDQLVAEGYLEGRVGSGMRVADLRPEDALEARPQPVARAPRRAARTSRLSRRGRMLATTLVTVARASGPLGAFRMGQPAIDEFPFPTWRRLAARFWTRPPRDLLTYGDPGGYVRLREAIAAHLRAARAVVCEPEQVIVVSGSQQALDLAARLLLDPGDAVWLEDPGYVGARGAFQAAGARVVPVPVDADGIDVARGIRMARGARVAYVSPSHQYPTGAVLARARRLALLEWARRRGAWILEDDYDSEFRYAGWPLESLQGIDGGERVLYVGTFSKVLLPSLRLGYLVVPRALVGAFRNARGLVDRQPPGPEQAALAAFLEEGHFVRHVRRMRVLYAERQAALVRAAERELASWVTVAPSPAGMHLVGRLRDGLDDRTASAAAEARGVEVAPLSRYAIRPRPAARGLLFGYAAFDPRVIRTGVRALAETLADLDSRARR